MRTGGYAAVVALTDDGLVPLTQYRPAVEARVLELPRDAIQEGESAVEAARRELPEETGCQCDEVLPLGRLHAGRFETQQWAFFAGRLPL